MSVQGRNKVVSLPALQRMKQRGTKICCVTAYDALFAHLQDEAGVDLILVGDSLGMVVQGKDDTLSVTLDDMVYHTRCVRRGVQHAFLVTDMPFMSVQVSLEEGLRACARVMAEGGAQAVKIEGCGAVLPLIEKLVACGIPVMGHLGLTPQSLHQLGGWGMRGKKNAEAERIIKDAKRLEEAGCFSLVLERIPAELARHITAESSIPTIGIGSGTGTDGQVLVNMDLLGLYEMKAPFVRRFASMADEVRRAMGDYVAAVRDGSFPAENEI